MKWDIRRQQCFSFASTELHISARKVYSQTNMSMFAAVFV